MQVNIRQSFPANPCKAAFSPNFFTAKVFYHMVKAKKTMPSQRDLLKMQKLQSGK